MRKPARPNKPPRKAGEKPPSEQRVEDIARKLLEIIVYRRVSKAGDRLTVGDLVETSEIGDWKMPAFKSACTYAARQGWLIIENDTLTLTIAGMRA
jgi:hypothetical protein